MKTYTADATVTPGFFFNLDRWELTSVQSGAGLPAGADRFLALPLPLVLAAAPVLGLLMVMFLPFIGFALTFGLLARKGLEAGQKAVYAVAALLQPAMRPGEAYLTGKRDVDPAETAETATLDALEREIAERRAARK